MSRDAGRDAVPRAFEEAAPTALADRRLPENLTKATTSIGAKRAAVVAEVPGWEALRDQGAAARDRSLHDLDDVLAHARATRSRRPAGSPLGARCARGKRGDRAGSWRRRVRERSSR